MTFPTIKIPDPASVGKWLDEELPHYDGTRHTPSFYVNDWWCSHYVKGGASVNGRGDTPEALLADIRRQLAENDPLEKLRKEWIAAGKPDLNACGEASGGSPPPSCSR